MKKKTIGIIAISVLCAFAIFAGAMFTHQYLDAKNSVEQFDELTDLIADVETGPETESPEESESTEEPELSEEELAAAQAALAHEKYGALFEQNQDFIGWIKIDGTKVDYPVMQSPNNPDYYLNDDQDSQLEELLNVDNSMWLAVLYGIYGSDDMIVQVALSQIGNVGGEPYWSWYGFGSRVEWCACFVSWCADQCGYIETGVCPKYAGCVNGVAWFKEHNQWVDGSETPSPGMIIFYDWDSPNGSSGPQDGLSDHTGIVEKVENGIIYTVEGNSGDSCRENHYHVRSPECQNEDCLCIRPVSRFHSLRLSGRRGRSY